jgi:hypothetical protein
MTKKLSKKELWEIKLRNYNFFAAWFKDIQDEFLAEARKAKCKFDHPKDIPLMMAGIKKTTKGNP